MKHLLGIESLKSETLLGLIEKAHDMKACRRREKNRPLENQTWALIFSKSSTRTRVSFEVGIRELGGDVMFLSSQDIQLGRGEPIKDTARVLGRYLDGAVIRTYAHEDVVDFASFSGIPTINALTDTEHPCQILADLQTIEEKRGHLEDLVVTFAGDGDCNVARSWLYAAKLLGFELRIAAPQAFQPNLQALDVTVPNIRNVETLKEAAEGSDVIYTDVWVSMGKEAESKERLALLAPFQIDHSVMGLAKPKALLMHCLPAYREKEVTESVLEAHAETIFTQAENRLHAQKAVLDWITTD